MLISAPLLVNNVRFVGASSIPSTVKNFKVTITDSIGTFVWDENEEIDIASYKIRFSNLTTGAVWETMQLVREGIKGNSVSLPAQVGTYMIKAVDILGNESINAAVIINFNGGTLKNVVENFVQQPSWSGVKVNCYVSEGNLRLIDTSLHGYYYFDADVFDLSEIYESFLSSSISAYGVDLSASGKRLRTISSIRSIVNPIRTEDLNSTGITVRNFGSIRSISSMRMIDPSSWSVVLEYSISNDGISWSDWTDFKIGSEIFRYLKLRLVLSSFSSNITPEVTKAEVKVDMPDRFEYGEDINCPYDGSVVTYSVPFKNNPSVNITLQNADSDDKIEYLYKNLNGFSFRVFNKTANDYVVRSYDFVSSGYGRIIQ